MDYLVNECSFAGQFADLATFGVAVDRLMAIRQEIVRAGSSLFCNKNLADKLVTPTVGMRQAVQSMTPTKRTAWLQWITRHGPFWNDFRHHHSDDWFDVKEEIVTDTSIAEAAFCKCVSLPRELVSLDPSNWLFSPLSVNWRRGESAVDEIEIENHWTLESVRDSLARNAAPILSWNELFARLPTLCPRLKFADDAFAPLSGHPFSAGAAERIQVLLHTLDLFCGCYDENGTRTAEGHRLYQDHFTGEKAWFSDSSETEKNQFRNELTFPCPGNSSISLFCPWHGKVKIGQLRVHFSWPIRFREPVFIVYVGPKITRR